MGHFQGAHGAKLGLEAKALRFLLLLLVKVLLRLVRQLEEFSGGSGSHASSAIPDDGVVLLHHVLVAVYLVELVGLESVREGATLSSVRVLEKQVAVLLGEHRVVETLEGDGRRVERLHLLEAHVLVLGNRFGVQLKPIHIVQLVQFAGRAYDAQFLLLLLKRLTGKIAILLHFQDAPVGPVGACVILEYLLLLLSHPILTVQAFTTHARRAFCALVAARCRLKAGDDRLVAMKKIPL